MPIIRDETAARAELERRVMPDQPPLLVVSDDVDEVAALLDAARVGGAWVADTSFAFDFFLMPGNGHKYRLLRVTGSSPVSGATEPTWPIRQGARIADGDLTWEEAGGEIDFWDLDRAAFEGWRIKQGRAALYTGDELRDIYTRCGEMMDRYRTARVA